MYLHAPNRTCHVYNNLKIDNQVKFQSKKMDYSSKSKEMKKEEIKRKMNICNGKQCANC